jgi:hypothetical protein
VTTTGPAQAPAVPDAPGAPAGVRKVTDVELRRTGLLLAIATGVAIVAGLSLLMFFRKVPAPGAQPEKRPVPAPAPDTLPAPTAQQVQQQGEGLRAGRARVSFFDRQDPSRTAAQLEWASLAPKEGAPAPGAGAPDTAQPDTAPPGESAVQKPVGTMFLRDGGLVVVRASRATFFTPRNAGSPESARFEEGVQLELFDAQPGRAVDPASDTPSVVGRCRTLLFEATESRVSTEDAFEVEAVQFDVRGRGARLIFDQVGQGISLAEIAQTEQVRLWPGGRPGLTGKGTSVRAVASETGARPGGPAPAQVGAERVYRLVVDDRVRVSQGDEATGVRLEAERAEAWVTTRENRLVEGAIAPLSGGAGEAGGAAGSDGAKKQGAVADATGATGAQTALPIIATWKGRLSLAPAPAVPGDFPGQLAAFRLMGGGAGPVRAVDSARALAMAAPIVDYLATTRSLALRGLPASKVVIDVGGQGVLVCAQATASLAQGVFEVVGAGELTSAGNQLGEGAIASFSKGLRLQLEMRHGVPVGRPQSVQVTGDVDARSGSVSVQGQEAMLTFRPADGENLRAPVLLQSAVIGRGARASLPSRGGAQSTPGGSPARDVLTGERIEVELQPDASATRTLPVAVVATGYTDAQNVYQPATATAGTTGGVVTVRAPTMRAELAQDEQRRTVVRQVIVTGDEEAGARERLAHVEAPGAGPGAPVLRASARRITADPGAQTAVLVGNPVTVSREGVTLTAGEMALDNARQTVEIAGPGRLVATGMESPSPGAPARSVLLQAGWTGSATLDLRAGRAVAKGPGGNVSAVVSAGSDEQNSVIGDELVLLLAPAEGASPGVTGPTSQLRSAEISGAPAKLEHRRFAISPGGARTTTRLVYLQAPRVLADAQQGTLRVPEAGRLLIDERPLAQIAQAPATGSAPGGGDALANLSDGRGTTLFAWTGSLDLSQRTGLIAFRQGVQMTHRPADAPQQRLTLDAAELDAVLAPQGSGETPGADAARADLVRVEARQGVRATSEGRELTARLLRYDAALGLMQAQGTDDDPVAFVDPQQPAPVRARELEWNLRAGRITTEGLLPIMLPAPR